MSWSGPLAGAAPYQPPYANGQLGYGQHQPYQHGQLPPHIPYQRGQSYPGHPQRSQENRQPKKKGNPIITRYPPPPGYRGPAQPQGPFNAHQHNAQYQAPPQPGLLSIPATQYSHSGQDSATVTPRQGHSSQLYGPPQPLGYPPSNAPTQNYHWPSQAPQPNQGLTQGPTYPGPQLYIPQTSYQPYPAHTAAVDPSRQAYSQSSGWPQTQTQSSYPPQKHYNSYSGVGSNGQLKADPNATPTPAATHLVSAPSKTAHPSQNSTHDGPTAPKPELHLAWDDWDFDFDGAIWPKSNEPVDPNLSLGVIIWHPAKQVTRALPATFDEAEEQSLKPTPETLGNGESVSVYFTAENSHEAFLDVRQTDAWEFIREDPVFVVFTDEEMCHNLVPIEDCITQRDRPDEPLETDADVKDAEMHEADWSVMDHLEQALSASGGDIEPAKARTQEDVLASLGVTGLPKPVPEEPVHSPMPAQEATTSVPLFEKPGLWTQSSTLSRREIQRSQSLGGSHVVGPPAVPQRLYGSMSSATFSQPPPPPLPLEYDQHNPWNPSHRRQQYHTNGFNSGRGSPARSEASNGTAAGSDFGTEKATETRDISLTPGSKFERSDSSVSRKRSYGDTDAGEDRLREHDDHTKRKRRSLVDAAYGRR